MTDLRDAAIRIAGMGRFPQPRADRKLAIEKAADRLANRPTGTLGESEPWDEFLHRIGVI